MFGRDCNPEYLFLNCDVAIEDESDREDINITNVQSNLDINSDTLHKWMVEMDVETLSDRNTARQNIRTEQERQKRIYDAKVDHER